MNTSHSSVAGFSDVESTRWLWPKWSTELDAFCDSAKSVIRRIGSKLQLEEEEEEEAEEEEEETVYFRPFSAASSTKVHLSPYDLGLGGVGREEEEDFQEGGVGDSDSGGSLSDVSVSTNLEHNYGYTHRRAENTHRPYPDELYPRKRLPATRNPSPEIDVVAYFTEGEYNEDEEDGRLYENHCEEHFESCEVRGRSLKRMAGPIVRASSPSPVTEERKKPKSSRRRSSSHEEENPAERERRRQERRERRKRRAEREGKGTHNAREHRQKKELSPPPSPLQLAPKKVIEVIRKDNKKNRYSVEDVLGLSGSRSRSISLRRPIRVRSNHSLRATRSDARLRQDLRLKAAPDGARRNSTKPAKEPSKLATVASAGQRSPSRQRHRRHHNDHSTPELRALCQRCIQKKEKREKKQAELNIEIAPEPVAVPVAAPKRVEVRIQEPKVERKHEDKAKVRVSGPVRPTLKRSKQAPGLAVERKAEKLVQCITCLADEIPHKEAAHLACDHSWCHECLKRIFTLSLTDPAHMPPTCCNDEHVPLKHVDKLLSYQTKKLWNKKYIEYTTSNRIYCPEVDCGEWIQPKDIEAGVGKCSRCKTKVCALCNGKAHGDGECPKDEDLMKFIETAKKNKFQRCYSCRAVVELERGCNHMT
ncbi:hypothetical protein C7212DRAFT_353864 [Tuber magnatum]|uniref:RBR-type E3 ubiquitin transferase n=1 Tax=Tuber magnatum TaxID=42249 RepID=A0A317SFR9_9PEZI|nr:hypothetical protein C7212DRAFT_353864 [Tuber magnatum]